MQIEEWRLESNKRMIDYLYKTVIQNLIPKDSFIIHFFRANIKVSKPSNYRRDTVHATRIAAHCLSLACEFVWFIIQLVCSMLYILNRFQYHGRSHETLTECIMHLEKEFVTLPRSKQGHTCTQEDVIIFLARQATDRQLCNEHIAKDAIGLWLRQRNRTGRCQSREPHWHEINYLSRLVIDRHSKGKVHFHITIL